MLIWFAISLGVGIMAVLMAVFRSSPKGFYANGIIERCFVMSADDDCLRVRAYVDETLVHELPAPSKLTGRMFIRGTTMSVPLTFERVPPYASRTGELSDADDPVLPVIFRFDRSPQLVVHPGQLVDVYIGER
jgi:HlyD family secretion protein